MNIDRHYIISKMIEFSKNGSLIGIAGDFLTKIDNLLNKNSYDDLQFSLNKTASIDINLDNQNEQISIIINIFNLEFIREIINNSFTPINITNYVTPTYLYAEELNCLINIINDLQFQNWMQSHKLIVIFGENALKDYFISCDTIFPTKILAQNEKFSHFTQLLNSIAKIREDNILYNRKKIIQLYQQKSYTRSLVIKKNLKVLIFTTIYSSAVQYYSKDLRLAFEKNGYLAELCIEKNVGRLATIDFLVESAIKYEPDIIVSINHFRFEWQNLIPDEIFVVTWLQDRMPFVVDNDSPKKLSARDLVLNSLYDDNSLKRIWQNALVSPMPVNHLRFKQVPEINNREIDIVAYSSHGSPLDVCSNFLRSIGITNIDILNIFSDLTQSFHAEALKEKFYWDFKYFSKLFNSKLTKCGLNFSSLSESNKNHLFRRYYNEVYLTIMRSVCLEWLANEDYKINIYGEGWVNHPVLNKYARGRADNTQLPNILSNAKIVIGNNANISAHPRVGEAILSGAAYIAWRIPKVMEVASLSTFMHEDVHISYFDNKKELIQNINKFLNSESARVNIVNAAKPTVLRNLTFDSLTHKIMDYVYSALPQ